MSPRLGRMYYSEAQRSPFLRGGGGIVSESIHSEATLREIDIEVKRLVDEGYRTAMDTLTSQRVTLEKIAADLMEMETMSAEHMHKIIDANRKGPKLMAGASVIAVEGLPAVETSEQDTNMHSGPGLEAAEG